MILLHPTYFPSIAQMVAVAQAEKVVFEIAGNYQKQSYRNRAYIAHSNGKLLLSVPIKHSKDSSRQTTKTVEIENSFPWQSQHWKSLQSAYRTSPFFEFYEDELLFLFERKATNLLEHNLIIFDTLIDLIGIEVSYQCTEEYYKNPVQQDLRYLATSKKEQTFTLQSYNQVLQKNGDFISNLSVLDLLFNQGPNSIEYLENQEIDL